MKTILVVANCMAIAMALLCGALYPAVREWSYWASGVFGLHLALELVIAHLKLQDAAKISTWCLQGSSAILTAGALIPYKLGLGDWWVLVAALAFGFTVLVTLTVALVFKTGGIGNLQPAQHTTPTE